jgi:hypothetical protein
MSRSGVTFAVHLIVASVAQDLAVGDVVHALGRDVTRHDVVHNLTESSAPSAQRRRCQELIPELAPLPPCVDTQFT